MQLFRPAMKVSGAAVSIETKKQKDLVDSNFDNIESLHKAIPASPVTMAPQITVKVVKQHFKETAG